MLFMATRPYRTPFYYTEHLDLCYRDGRLALSIRYSAGDLYAGNMCGSPSGPVLEERVKGQ